MFIAIEINKEKLSFSPIKVLLIKKMGILRIKIKVPMFIS